MKQASSPPLVPRQTPKSWSLMEAGRPKAALRARTKMVRAALARSPISRTWTLLPAAQSIWRSKVPQEPPAALKARNSEILTTNTQIDDQWSLGKKAQKLRFESRIEFESAAKFKWSKSISRDRRARKSRKEEKRGNENSLQGNVLNKKDEMLNHVSMVLTSCFFYKKPSTTNRLFNLKKK